ncbi:MAG: hypothetical protein VCC36_08905 [Gammaproteobacteria bacterium]
MEYAYDFGGANLAYTEQIQNPIARLNTHLANTKIHLGDRDEAGAILRRIEAPAIATVFAVMAPQVAYGYSQLGLQRDADRVVAALEEAEGRARLSAANWVLINLARGDEEAALIWLRIVAEKEPYKGYVLVNRIKANVFQDPVLETSEFIELRNQIGFTDLSRITCPLLADGSRRLVVNMQAVHKLSRQEVEGFSEAAELPWTLSERYLFSDTET